MNTLNGIQENKKNNEPIIYADYEEGIKKLIEYHKTTIDKGRNYVDFNVGFIPGLPGLSPSKIAKLQERGWMVTSPEGFGVFLIKEDSKKQIETAKIFFKDLTKKILDNIGFDEACPSFIRNNKDIPIEKVTPYMRIQDFYTKKELLEENKEQLRNVEFFNNKVNLLNFLQESFPEVVPSKSKTSPNAENIKNYLLGLLQKEDLSFPIFVKSGIGASGSGLWKLDNIEELKSFVNHFDTKTKDFLDIYTIFDDNGEIIDDLEYSFEKGKWLNTRRKDMPFMVQENTISEFKNTDKVKEKSINFFIDDNGVYIVTEGLNNAKDGEYVGNIQIKLKEKERNKFIEIAKEIQNKGYRGPIGFDFFSDGENIKIIESNPRNSGATNPQILTYNLSKKLKKDFKRQSDTIKIDQDILNYDDLLFTRRKGYGVIPQISWDANTKKQSIVIIYQNDSQLQVILKSISGISS